MFMLVKLNLLLVVYGRMKYQARWNTEMLLQILFLYISAYIQGIEFYDKNIFFHPVLASLICFHACYLRRHITVMIESHRNVSSNLMVLKIASSSEKASNGATLVKRLDNDMYAMLKWLKANRLLDGSTQENFCMCQWDVRWPQNI